MAEIKGLMELEVKTGEDGGFTGVLSTYGNVDLAGDVCEPHCFDRTVETAGTRRPLLWQHDQAEPIGHLEITDTVSALSVVGKFNLDTQRGREAYSLLKNGDINGLSIGYTATDYKYDNDGVRHLLDVDLFEGSLVSVPCNQLARAQAKSARLAKMSIFAQCKFLSKLSAKDRDDALAELDALELKATEPDPEANPSEDPAEEPKPEETEDEEKSKKDEESEPKDPAEDPEEIDDDTKAALKTMSAKLDAILKKLEA